MMSEQNIEIINGIPVDWGLFKSKVSGKRLENAKTGYIGLCELLYSKGHKLRSEYINATTKVLIDFNCGHEPSWIVPGNYKSGHGCPKCSGNCSEQAKEDLEKLIKNNNHKLLSEYINNSTKVLIDFNCEHEPHWIRPSDYKSGKGCPRCGGRHSEQAKEDFMNMLEENGHKLLSEYISNSTKSLIDFSCGHEPNWIIPNAYKNGNGCPRCVGRAGQAKEDLINLIHENNHELLSEYINNSTKVLINFNCGHEAHWITPDSYKSGKRCPLCKNKGESALYQLLLDMSYKVKRQKKYLDLKDKYLLPYDFYLPEYNLLIELDGDHHRRPVLYYTKDMTQQEKNTAKLDAEIKFHDRQRRDKMKNEYAEKNNIPLLRIPYYNGKIELDKWRELILNKIKEIELISL